MTGHPDPIQAAGLAKKYGLRRSVEVLAPAGDGEALRAAVFAGANAVYLGLKQFSARRTAGNFDEQQLKEAVAFCHARDVRVHAAVNTTAFSGELGLLAGTIASAAAAGVDALIVQNPYAMGYLGVESAYRLLTGKEPAAKRVDTATTLVTRENMYRPEYQKILFRYE